MWRARRWVGKWRDSGRGACYTGADSGEEVALDPQEQLARQVVDILEENRAAHITLLDLRPDTIIADFFILCTATSERQIRALVGYVRGGVRDERGQLPHSIEGSHESGWQLLDYGAVVVHVFLEDVRRYYDLEGLWRDATVMVNIV